MAIVIDVNRRKSPFINSLTKWDFLFDVNAPRLASVAGIARGCRLDRDSNPSSCIVGEINEHCAFV